MGSACWMCVMENACRRVVLLWERRKPRSCTPVSMRICEAGLYEGREGEGRGWLGWLYEGVDVMKERSECLYEGMEGGKVRSIHSAMGEACVTNVRDNGCCLASC